MRIGILAAMEVEMSLILDELEDLESVKVFDNEYHAGKIGNVDVVVVKAGIGKVNAAIVANNLIREFECSLVINSGIAGGTKPLKHRDVVIASKLLYHDFDATIFGYKYGQVPGMPAVYYPNIDSVVLIKSVLNKLNIGYKESAVYTGDQFVTSMDALKNFDDVDGVAIEMEGCAVAQACTKAGVDFIILRYISDIIGEENQEEGYLEFERDMAEQSAMVTIKLIRGLA